ncbi:MAG: sulfotransferase domain-containing protein [Bacteroidota bacterium]
MEKISEKTTNLVEQEGKINHHTPANFKPFVVFGAAKSGTTWLQRIVHAHPQCHCHFQIPILPLTPAARQAFRPANIHVVYGERKSPYGGIFGSEIEEQEYHWKSRFLKRLPILQANYVAQYQEQADDQEEFAYLQGYHRGMQAALAQYILTQGVDSGISVHGTKAVTDLEELFAVLPQVKVLTIVRDGRDVIVSKRFHAYRMKVFMHGDEKSRLHYWLNDFSITRYGLLVLQKVFRFLKPQHFKDVSQAEHLLNREVVTKYATEWKHKVEYIQSYAQQYPDQFLTVRYEDLLEEPASELERIFSFLGVKASPRILRAIIEKTTFAQQRTQGNQSFFRKGKSGDWVQYFKPRDKALFKQIAGQTLIDLGYTEDADW